MQVWIRGIAEVMMGRIGRRWVVLMGVGVRVPVMGGRVLPESVVCGRLLRWGQGIFCCCYRSDYHLKQEERKFRYLKAKMSQWVIYKPILSFSLSFDIYTIHIIH